MSEALAGLAGPLTSSGGTATRLPRLWLPIALAVGMHAAWLGMRAGGPDSGEVPSASRTMTVRLVRPSQVSSVDVPADAERPELVPPTAREPSLPTGETAGAGRQPRVPQGATAALARERGFPPTRSLADAHASRAPAAAAPNVVQGVNGKGLPAAPDYALGAGLDPGPRPLDEIAPEYPEAGHLREGTVVLRLLISDSGHVDDVAVVRSEPALVFDQAALEAFAKARFAPGLAAGRPVKSQITVEVQFMPINRGSRVSGRTY